MVASLPRRALKPRYWLAAHMHCFFPALVPHSNKNPGNDFGLTRFLSLDKPLPRRHFLQALEFNVNQNVSLNLSYDPTWLAILKATDSLTSNIYMPSQHTRNERWDFRPTKEEIAKVVEIYDGDFTIPMNFKMTARPHRVNETNDISQELYYRNPQSAEFCEKLGIKDLNEMLCSLSLNGVGVPYYITENSDSRSVVLENRTSERKEDFDEDNDFIIDNNPTPEALLMDDLKTPAIDK
ncbi:unnamed protein product [Litomosoides sigmodontis]|uniref:Lariat debranching enzyme C-terminal domain-containing protein n=1 Tax=Litomosoides sigmodontis TaxID=42156 RepID=A0A3P6U5J0_LITSI|nr:unnamed protein product [Litomosoides sigmodontis]